MLTMDDVKKIMFVIKCTYPNSPFNKATTKELEFTAMAWSKSFSDYTYEQISAGLEAFMSSDTSGFAPVPSQIIKYARMNAPQNELTANEAWALVDRALRNSLYNAEAEFEKLPPAVQKAIGGNAACLKELAQMDYKSVQDVHGSVFKKQYDTYVAREKEYLTIPESVRTLLEAANPTPTMIASSADRVAIEDKAATYEAARQKALADLEIERKARAERARSEKIGA